MAQPADHLAGAYGFGLFPTPAYRPARRGDWRVATHLPSLAAGYLTPAAVEARAVLTRGGVVWMSTGLLERESHAWHVHCARGVVVTAGFGMGLFAHAVARKPEVDLVIAADISGDVIGLMEEAADMAAWPGRDKLRLVQADVLAGDFAAVVAAHTDGRPVDYLYADIWPSFPAGQAPAQTAALARALHPRAAGWWGQELSFGVWCRRREGVADSAALGACFAAAGVPAPPITTGYAAFCRDILAAHGMDGPPPAWRRLAASLRGMRVVDFFFRPNPVEKGRF